MMAKTVRWLDRGIAYGPYYTLCLDERALHRELKKLDVPLFPFTKNERSHATTHFMRSRKGDSCAIVCLKNWETRSGIEVAGLLVHEAVHIWQEWRDSVGEDNPGSEQEAYAVQWFSQQLMWEFARQTGVMK